MIKKVALALMIATIAQAEVTVDRFELEEVISRLYIQTDIEDFNQEHMAMLSFIYVDWVAEIKGNVKTLDDAKYVSRLAHMFGEVCMSYYFPVKESVPTQP